MPLVRVPLGDPAGRSRWVVAHEGRSYLVLVVEDGYVVTDALCPHKQNPLAAGLLRDGALVCPGHWYAFDLATGACRNADERPLAVHPVVSTSDGLVAEVVVEPARSWSERLRAHAAGSDGP